ncbi:hypothetical protein EPA93_10930 [Ktedonosporobacter rubrisoli]|uniref:non-specific serine/threonine protein kinase n=1 Tax=Ktedonosporobacter rubrisoli TaxID=2509675 RepID=A0A4P6JMM0_KTERU|nr:protein kinase [Ktedonosporobacter rubrisoli]QBD76495.1 hypothetical protein EPA93_10930 [Ktedonosporobacter rubrisoli]
MSAALVCDFCGTTLPEQSSFCPQCGKAMHVLQAQGGASVGSGSLLQQRYRLLEKVGEGGFAFVYKARDEQRHGKLVAVKQINLAAMSAQEKIEATDTYNREITLLSALYHKSLPRLYDHFTDPEHWYIVMDYIAGETLEDRLAKFPGGRLPLRDVVSIGLALCDVLNYLHTQDPPIIFRDVKPANIMLTRTNHVYLIDFGIARRYREGSRRDTGVLGSPGYAAPEQYGKAQTTPQSDIYGLGATLQTLITGKEPLDIHMTGIPSDCPIPPLLRQLLAHMLERDPALRLASAKEAQQVLKSLQQALWMPPLWISLPGLLLLGTFVLTHYQMKSGWIGLMVPAAAIFFSRLAYYKNEIFQALSLKERMSVWIRFLLGMLFWSQFVATLNYGLFSGGFWVTIALLAIGILVLLPNTWLVGSYLHRFVAWLRAKRKPQVVEPQKQTQP